MRRLLPLLFTAWNQGNLIPFICSFGFRHQQSIGSFHRLHKTASPLSMMKRDSPSAQRNKQPIWEVLSSKVLSRIRTPSSTDKLRVLEVAAGCGVHTEYFSLALSQTLGRDSVRWYPTDPLQDSLHSIQCYIEDNADALSEVATHPMALTLDAQGIQETNTKNELLGSKSGDQSTFDLIVCINMIHISPWEATLGLMKLAGESLSEKGCLYCYGPYKVGGTAVESNLYVD
jgi:Protein of unknown function (DUF938)